MRPARPLLLAQDRSRGLISDVNALSRRKGVLRAVFHPNDGPEPTATAPRFPNLALTSLTGRTVHLADAARDRAPALVLVVFREFAEPQLRSWDAAAARAHLPTYELTVNETVVARWLAPLVRWLDRRRRDPTRHDHLLALNQSADVVESVLLDNNRLFAHALLLDAEARIRFRAYGMCHPEAEDALAAAAGALRQTSLRQDAHAPSEPLL